MTRLCGFQHWRACCRFKCKITAETGPENLQSHSLMMSSALLKQYTRAKLASLWILITLLSTSHLRGNQLSSRAVFCNLVFSIHLYIKHAAEGLAMQKCIQCIRTGRANDKCTLLSLRRQSSMAYSADDRGVSRNHPWQLARHILAYSFLFGIKKWVSCSGRSATDSWREQMQVTLIELIVLTDDGIAAHMLSMV